MRLTPIRGNSLSHQQGEVWLGRKLGQPLRTRSDSTASNQAGQSRPAMTLRDDPGSPASGVMTQIGSVRTFFSAQMAAFGRRRRLRAGASPPVLAGAIRHERALKMSRRLSAGTPSP